VSTQLCTGSDRRRFFPHRSAYAGSGCCVPTLDAGGAQRSEWRKMKTTVALLGILLLMAVPVLQAEQAAPSGDQPGVPAEVDTDLTVRGVVPLPVFGVSPEDGVLLGVAALFFRVPEPGAPTDTISTNAFYGTAGTFALNVGTDHRITARHLNLTTYHRASIFSAEYYGIGMDADEAEQFETLELRATGALLFPVYPQVSIGPGYQINYFHTRKTEADGSLASGDIRGGDFAFGVGAGVRFVYDTRDSNVYPTSGGYVDLESLGHPTWLGSSDTFWLGQIDVRHFVSPWPWLIVGGQAVLQLSAGDVPFQFLPAIGGGDLMRGVLDGRYRDRVSLATQLEIRFPIYWRFGGTAFVGAGRVAPSVDRLYPDDLAVAGGLGLRFAVNPEQKLNIRLDLAHDGDSLKVYVNFQEAF
jgi:hypothetical protein